MPTLVPRPPAMPATTVREVDHPAPPGVHTVAAVVYDGLAPFEYGIAHEMFGLDRPELGNPYRFLACAAEPGRLRAAAGGLDVVASHGLDHLADADTVIVPGWRHGDLAHPPAPLLDAIVTAHARGARIASLCSGIFVLAAAGLLAGRRATTHWLFTEKVHELYPDIELVPDVLYVEAEPGRVFTSAGSAAGLDLCLHLIRADCGSEAANVAARRAVVPPLRSGGQAQFVQTPVPEPDDPITLNDVLAWMEAHLEEPQPVDELARRAAMSPRTFARRFRQVTGTSPNRWLLEQRVRRARELLETTGLSIDLVASTAGFGTAETLRHHFRRHVGVSPTQYRQSFQRLPA